MADIEVGAIAREIARRGANWAAGETTLTQGPDEERKARLGVIRNGEELARLRKGPAPNVAAIAIESARRLAIARGHMAEPDIAALSNAVATFLQLRPLPPPLWTYSAPYLCWLRYVDWRNRFGINGVTPIKDQGGCSSCVAFGTTAMLESMVLIEHNVATDFSEAELLFCGGGSCGGWWPSAAVAYIQTSGVAQESCFPYEPRNMPCQPCCRRDGEAIRASNSSVIVDVAQRKDYLFMVGPTAGCFAVYDDFFAYRHGVYSHVTGVLAGYHCVEVIGYDETNKCWICKNSWGPGWGEGGFFRIAFGECELDSSFPFWGITRTQWF